MNQAQIAAVTAALAAVLGQLPASAKVSRKTKAKAAKIRRTPEALQASLEAACRRAGIKGPVVQHQTVLTYDGWLAKGRRVIKGQKGLPGFKNLFHLEQTAEEPKAG